MTSRIPECSVVIPVFNKWDLTRNCLESLREHSAGRDIEIVVADNASSDATATELAPLGAALFGERFTVLRFPENRNFGPASNAGAEAATSPVLFFLNNDTLVTPGWLDPLLAGLAEEGTGAAGPLLLYEDDTVQHLGAVMGALGPLHLYQGFPASHPLVRKKRTLQFLTAAALMMRKDLFDRCGRFYEGYRNGYEDLELCVRIREQGKTLRCVPDSVIYHLESQTPGRKDSEEHNGALLGERCGDAVFIDMHHHALRDGFEVFITDLLSVGIRMKPGDEAALAARANDGDAAGWLRLTRENPLWIKGREVLAHSLEQAGKWNEALRFRAELADIEWFTHRFRELLALKPFVDNDSWGELATKRLDLAVRYQTDQTLARSMVQKARKRFKPGGDPFLEQLYADKLRDMFPG